MLVSKYRTLITFALLGTAFAQLNTIREAVWSNPSGKAADSSLSFQTGSSVVLTWNGYNPADFVSIDFFDTKKLADLWVVESEDVSQKPFSQIITCKSVPAKFLFFLWNDVWVGRRC
jgi:hypothetical protein